jgi:hypothetical protein
MMMALFRRPICGLVLTLVASSLAHGQAPATSVTLPGENIPARNRLRVVDGLLEPIVSPRAAAGCVGRLGFRALLDPPAALASVLGERPLAAWDQAEDGYYYLLNDFGEALVSLPPEAHGLATAWTSMQMRRLCHTRIAALPAGPLAAYRQRVDAEARRLLGLGRSNRDPAPLRQLVDEMLCSSFGGEALDLLGDLAFERGDFDEARHWWRLLAPLDSIATEGVLFPAPKMDLARTAAKQILALAFQGRVAQAQEELDRVHERFPGATGPLAGKRGLYSEAVRAAIHDMTQAGIANNADAWPTFAGSASRNHPLSVCPPPGLWADGPGWHVALPPLDARSTSDKNGDLLGRGNATRRAAFHPVITGHQVLLADANSVTSYHLLTGKRLFRYDLKSAGLPEGNSGDRRIPLPRFTLTADEGRAYARLGQQWLFPRGDNDASEPSYLICIDISGTGDGARPRELWHVKSRANEFFEGAPLVCHGRAYIALSRLTGRRVVTAIQCYDSRGRLSWSRDVCEAPEFEDHTTPRCRHHLLTWGGGQIVYCTHTGAVVAVDPWSGQTLWAVRYVSRSPLAARAEPSPRDIAPCVYDDGRVFAAPLDSDRLYCLEACTGRVLWEREGLDIVHIVGVTRGRVLLTTRYGMHAVASATGLTVWQQPSVGRLPCLGRGLLAGHWLLWPTQDEKLPTRTLTVMDGMQQKDEPFASFAEPAVFDPTQLRLIPPGNMALGQGCLLVAGIEELTAFVPLDRLAPVPPAVPRPPAGAAALVGG